MRAAADRGAYFFLNPGSMALPKGDGVHSYMVYEDGVFTTKDMEDVYKRQVLISPIVSPL